MLPKKRSQSCDSNIYKQVPQQDKKTKHAPTNATQSDEVSLDPVEDASLKGGPTKSKWNHNVVVIMIYTFIVQLARSIWQSQILSIYLYDLCDNDTRVVGYIEGVQGICRLVTAALTGIAIDGWIRKHKNMALRVSCIYGLCLFGSCAFCVIVVRKAWVWFLLLGLYSPQRSLQMSAVGTIFADSMKSSDRVHIYSVYRVVSNLGAVVGPTLQIAFFLFAGNEWTPRNLRIVMLVGIGCSAMALPLQLFIDENRTLGDSSEAKQRQATFKDAQREAEIEQDEFNARLLRWSIVAYDLFRVTFGGLVDKYFGIFFTEHVGIKPIQLSLIQMACRAGIIVTTAAVGGLASYIPAAIVVSGLLVAVNLANVTLAINPANLAWVAVIAYIVRGSALVSVFGLKHALLMDRVPKKHRGKFSALDDLQSGFWSGTAALGGLLIHHFGYGLAFGVMAAGFGGASVSWMGVVYSDCRAQRFHREETETSETNADGKRKGPSGGTRFSGGTTYSGQLETSPGLFSRNDSMLFGDGFAVDSDHDQRRSASAPLIVSPTLANQLQQPLVCDDSAVEEGKAGH